MSTVCFLVAAFQQLETFGVLRIGFGACEKQDARPVLSGVGFLRVYGWG